MRYTVVFSFNQDSKEGDSKEDDDDSKQNDKDDGDDDDSNEANESPSIKKRSVSESHEITAKSYPVDDLLLV